ncbi:hypothetical protein JCM1841_001460 [Sporobolomyces salmonicolor]
MSTADDVDVEDQQDGQAETSAHEQARLSSRPSGPILATTISIPPPPQDASLVPVLNHPPFPAPAASSSTSSQRPPRPPKELDEVESLADGLSKSFPTTSLPRRRGSFPPLLDSEPDLVPAEQARRPSVDGSSSIRKGRSFTHRVNPGAKSYFPLINDPRMKRKASISAGSASSSPPSGSPTSQLPPSPGALSMSNAETALSECSSRDDRPSRSSSDASAASSIRPAVFPTITPDRSAASSVFPRLSSSAWSSIPLPPPATSPPRSSFSSSHQPGSAPSIASSSSSCRSRQRQASNASSLPPTSPSSLSSSVRSSRRREPSDQRSISFPAVASTTAPPRSSSEPSMAPSPSIHSAEGPTSLFMNPASTKRPLTDLLPKRRLSSLFSSSKDKSKPQQPVPAPGHRPKSALILDAALTTSQTWAIRRGEQHRMAMPPAGYRPGHKQRRETSDGGSSGVSGDVLADAPARNEGTGRRRDNTAESSIDLLHPDFSGYNRHPLKGLEELDVVHTFDDEVDPGTFEFPVGLAESLRSASSLRLLRLVIADWAAEQHRGLVHYAIVLGNVRNFFKRRSIFEGPRSST